MSPLSRRGRDREGEATYPLLASPPEERQQTQSANQIIKYPIKR
jgi:hypothetical protein